MVSTNTTDCNARKQELLQLIYNAFPEGKPPKPNEVVPTKPGYDLEADQIRKKFGGKSWHILALDPKIWVEHASLYFMTLKASNYYFPAFLAGCLILEDPDMLLDSTIYNLTPSFWEPYGLSEYQHWVSLFTEDQKHVIASFLRYVQDCLPEEGVENDVKKALKEYWDSY